MNLDDHGNHTRAELEMEIIGMLRRLKIAPIVMTRADGDNLLDTGRYNWEFFTLRGGGYTIVEALEDALNQSMAYLWAVEEESVESRYVVPPLPSESLTKSYRPGHTETQANFVSLGSSEMQVWWRTKTVVGGERNLPKPSSSFSLIACEAVSEEGDTFFRPKPRPRAEAVQEGVAFATLVPVRLRL
jgi:hypothetical protein